MLRPFSTSAMIESRLARICSGISSSAKALSTSVAADSLLRLGALLEDETLRLMEQLVVV